MGKTQRFFEENWRYQRNISCKDGHNKGHRNSKDLTEAEEIKKRWQEYTEELYPDNHDCVVTNLEPDILECEVKWALGSITLNKATRDDGIPAELFPLGLTGLMGEQYKSYNCKRR